MNEIEVKKYELPKLEIKNYDEILEKSMNEEIRQGEEDEILRKIMQIYEIEEKNPER